MRLDLLLEMSELFATAMAKSRFRNSAPKGMATLRAGHCAANIRRVADVRPK
jgi:hypothetical protein